MKRLLIVFAVLDIIAFSFGSSNVYPSYMFNGSVGGNVDTTLTNTNTKIKDNEQFIEYQNLGGVFDTLPDIATHQGMHLWFHRDSKAGKITYICNTGQGMDVSALSSTPVRSYLTLNYNTEWVCGKTKWLLLKDI